MDLESLLIAALTGFISGLILCIPVGPINLIILNEGARRGFRWALMIGLGTTVMEMIYCFVAFSSFASLFSKGKVEFFMRMLGSAFTLIFGIKFLMAKSVDAPLHLTARADALGHRIEEKLHPSSAFTTGFVRVLANPGVLVGWIVLGANFISHGWVTPDWPGKISCVAGVTISIGGWFAGLSWLAALGHGKLGPRGLLRMERISGVLLIAISLGLGFFTVWGEMHPKPAKGLVPQLMRK